MNVQLDEVGWYHSLVRGTPHSNPTQRGLGLLWSDRLHGLPPMTFSSTWYPPLQSYSKGIGTTLVRPPPWVATYDIL